jgi:hypothetical protein
MDEPGRSSRSSDSLSALREASTQILGGAALRRMFVRSRPWRCSLGDPLCQERCVAPHPSQERRPARVLPRQADEAESRYGGDSTLMNRPTALVQDGNAHVAEVHPEASCPDDCSGFYRRAIGHRQPISDGAGDSPRQLHTQ